MPDIRYQNDANLELLQNRKVAIIGYGSQGHAHALNLRDSGIKVCVGLRPTSQSVAKAEASGLEVLSVDKACAASDIVMVLAPDTSQPAIYHEQIAPNLEDGNTLMFAHGFNIRFGTIDPPKGIDVSMVAPKSPGHRVRETFEEGGGVPALLAVHQDATGHADAVALAYAAGIGCARAGVLKTTFSEETETDLFGEQAVLCGGVSELVKAGFETLVDAGYQPEIAYFECLHELKLIVDLMYRGGLTFMRHSISDTAEYGDYQAGRRVIGTQAREQMQELLAEIRSGAFAKQWIKENEQGRPNYNTRQKAEREQLIEEVGHGLRKMMPFIDAASVDEKVGRS